VDAFVAFGQGLLLVFIALAPLLVTVIVLGVITLIIVRTVKKRRANKNPENNTTISETERNE
jgi:heme/copper-type cytochrome/quinol oxidase subunit 2